MVHGQTLRRSYEAKRTAINRKLREAEKSLARWYEAFESGELEQVLGTTQNQLEAGERGEAGGQRQPATIEREAAT